MTPASPQPVPADTGSRDPIFGQVLYFGAVLFLTLYILIVFLQAWYYHVQRVEDQLKIVAPEPYTLTESRQQQAAQLEGYRWMNRPQNIVSIPIEQAMRITIREIAGEEERKP